MSLGFDRHNQTPSHRLTLAQFAGLCLFSLGYGIALWFLLNGWQF